jgi:hypothetical protein
MFPNKMAQKENTPSEHFLAKKSNLAMCHSIGNPDQLPSYFHLLSRQGLEMISYWLAQFSSRDNKTSARNKKKTLFQEPKKPWKKDSMRCLHLSTRVNGYLKLFYFGQATVIGNRVGYALFFYLHVSLEMLQHQYIDVNSGVDNVTTATMQRGRTTKVNLNILTSPTEPYCNTSIGSEIKTKINPAIQYGII